MRTWIEFHPADLVRLKKFSDLRHDLGWSVNEMVGFLGLFWDTVMQLAESGNVSEWTSAYVGDVCRATETQLDLIEVLTKHKFLDRTPEGVVLVHDWLDYAGRYLINKYASSDVRKLKQIWALHGRVYGKRNATTTQVKRLATQPHPTIPNPTEPNLNQPTRGQAAHAFLTLFHDKYLEKWKQKPTINAYDVKNLQRLVEGLVNGDAEKIIAIYFDDPAYVGHSLQTLYQAKTWDRMRGKLRGEKFLVGAEDSGVSPLRAMADAAHRHVEAGGKLP